MDKYASLTPNVKHILLDKGTEPAFSGQYLSEIEHGSYLCRGCGNVLFRTTNQFLSHCGWPSFDDEVPNAILRKMDRDGRRTEILCAECHGHLGHVFNGEGFTPKNLRHCVNSLSIEFVSNTHVTLTDEAIVAGGCFWGVQYLLDQLPGILLTEVGYAGGTTEYPTYQQVCSHKTGHVEAIRIVFDREKQSYESILKFFMEIHDPTQNNGQGPDIGSQYLSYIFYFNQRQKSVAESVTQILMQQGLNIATRLKPVTTFWPAEIDHQKYYANNKEEPYCHHYTKRFF